MLENKWTKVGVVGVDAGLIWVGDPCYIMGDDASNRVKSWSEFCKLLNVEKVDGVMEPLKHGIGLAISSGYGDGVYPVSVKYNDEGRVAALKVDFIEG